MSNEHCCQQCSYRNEINSLFHVFACPTDAPPCMRFLCIRVTCFVGNQVTKSGNLFEKILYIYPGRPLVSLVDDRPKCRITKEIYPIFLLFQIFILLQQRNVVMTGTISSTFEDDDCFVNLSLQLGKN